MSLNFCPCKIPIPYDASHVYDACNVLVKSYSKSIVATTHCIVLVKSTTDLNPIENVFHLANKDLRKSAKKITNESREEFVARIRKALYSVPMHTIDKTISSMGKRVDMIIKSHGERIKY